MSVPYATFSMWQNCKTIGGQLSCLDKFTNPEAAADCSEMDDRTTTVGFFSMVWVVANAQTIVLLLWAHLTGSDSPVRNLVLALFAWSGGCAVVTLVVVAQTLIASLCNNPTAFFQDGGSVETGGIFLFAASCVTLIPFLGYLLCPAD
jgi:hypothetical protein